MAFHLTQSITQELEYFRTLKGKGGYLEQGIFIAEGPKIVRRILESSADLVSLYATQEHFERVAPLLERRSNQNIPVHIAPKEEMEAIVGYPLHQGLMLAARIPRARTIEEASQVWKKPFLVAALDSIADAENMGTLIRNAAAFNIDAIIIDDQSCDPYLRRSVRVSMGTIVKMEIIRVASLAESLQMLRETTNAHVMATSLSSASITLEEQLRSVQGKNLVCVLGSEGHGIRKDVLAACDAEVIIPMANNVDSLNVGVASGIFLYELKRALTRDQSE